MANVGDTSALDDILNDLRRRVSIAMGELLEQLIRMSA